MKQQLLLTFLCALLFSLSFPPFITGFLAYFALVPLLFLLDKMSIRQAVRWGYIVGLLVSIGTLYWILWPTPAGAIATILIHPIFSAIFAGIYAVVKKGFPRYALFMVPLLWTAVEYLKALGELAFPWILLGYTQTYYPALIQYAAYTGVFGVSFWVAVVNVVFFQIVKHAADTKKVAIHLAFVALLLIVPQIYGKIVISAGRGHTEKTKTAVAIVQGNIDPYMKWDKQLLEMNFVTYERLTHEVAKDTVDVVIWPETATPTWLLHDAKNLARVRQLAIDLDTPILTGIPDYLRLANNSYKTFNSLVLIDSTAGPYPKYAKTRLVPFGERVPYEDTFPLVKKLLARLEMGEGNFSPGDKIVLFDLPLNQHRRPAPNTARIKIGGVICFESIFPDLVANFVRQGAQLLVIVTNDGWYGRTAAPFEHAQMAIFRAIENRISVARSANTGISMTIDPYGQVRKESKTFAEAILFDTLPVRHETTFYTRHGDLFAKVIAVLALLVAVAAVVNTHYRRII